MPRYIPLQRNVHQNSGWRPARDYSFTKDNALVPILAEEISHVLPHMSIAFSENTNVASGFDLIGIQSLQPGINLFVHPDGRWLSGYVPAIYRGYPFALLQEEGTDNLHLCIEAESDLFHETAQEGDLPLLTDTGEPEAKVSEMMNFLQQCHKNRLATQNLVQQLAKHNLIQPWAIDLKQSETDDKAVPVQGLYQIDREALKQLAPEHLSELCKSGALAMAYSQILSKPRLSGLTPLYTLRDQLAKQQAQQQQLQETNLDQLFGENAEEDIFKF